MPVVDTTNILSYIFYALLLVGAGAAEYLHLVPVGTLLGLLGGMGVGHGVGTSLATRSTLRQLLPKNDSPQLMGGSRHEAVTAPTIAVPGE